MDSGVPDIKKDDLTIYSLNINSLPSKFDLFKEHVFSNNKGLPLDIIGICESKLTNDIAHLFPIPNYEMFVNNNSRASGGLALYVNSKHKEVTLRDDLVRKMEYINTLFIEIKSSPRNIICGLIYHKPNSNKVEFLNELNNIFENLATERKKIYLFGDFNTNLLDHKNNAQVRQFINIFHGNN